MDWKDLKPIIGGSAPLIGKLIGVGLSFIPVVGPIAGPIMGPAIGAILAKEFGVAPTPDAVAGAIAANGGAESEVVKAKLAAATEQIKAQYEWAAKVETGELHLQEVSIEQVNQTMQAELGHEHWFFTGWRPFIGWVFGTTALAYGLMLVGVTAVLTWRAPDAAAALQALREAWPLYLSYFGPLGAAVGVLIGGRTVEKKTAIENAAPMPNATIPAPTPAPTPAKPVIKVTPVGKVIPKLLGRD